MEERLTSHYESLSRAIQFARTADAKAGPVFALQLAMMGTIGARSNQLLQQLEGSCNPEQVVLVFLGISYVIVSGWALLLAARVYVPIDRKTGRSLIFYRDIASMEYRSFEDQAKQMSPEVIESQLLDQVYRVSQVSSIKMDRVRHALILSLPSCALWLFLVVWVHLP